MQNTKLDQLTEFDILADEVGIIDRNTFLKNIELLAKSYEKYRKVFDEIIKMSNTYVEIEKDLSYNDWYNEMHRLYRCMDSLSLGGVYNRICTEYDIELQKYTDFNEMYQVMYNTYIKDYDKYIKLIKDLLTIEGRKKWMIPIVNKPKEKIPDKNSDGTWIIPPIPQVPI